MVLRRPPRPPFPPSAHDMLREARLLLGLRRAGVRVPAVLAVCEDEHVIGAGTDRIIVNPSDHKIAEVITG